MLLMDFLGKNTVPLFFKDNIILVHWLSWESSWYSDK
jgi:hypothetical protein